MYTYTHVNTYVQVTHTWEKNKERGKSFLTVLSDVPQQPALWYGLKSYGYCQNVLYILNIFQFYMVQKVKLFAAKPDNPWDPRDGKQQFAGDQSGKCPLPQMRDNPFLNPWISLLCEFASLSLGLGRGFLFSFINRKPKGCIWTLELTQQYLAPKLVNSLSRAPHFLLKNKTKTRTFC